MTNRFSGFDSAIRTPILAVDVARLSQVLSELTQLRMASGVLVLFAPKASSIPFVLETIGKYVDGFACSSVNELRLIRHVAPSSTLHFTTPGIRPDEMDDIEQLCSYLTLNSVSQWQRYVNKRHTTTHLGVRVNPRLSFVRDERYDPCRESSKLGVPIEAFANSFSDPTKESQRLSGLHFHTNCDSVDFGALKATAQYLESQLPQVLERLKWINLGGGYLFGESEDLGPFYDTVELFRDKYGLKVFIEPGASVVRNSGFLISSVIDKFVSDSREIVVLDTTVNHMPEVLEYNYQPIVAETMPNGPYEYMLVGCTCLAGDVFGEYSFLEPLEIGSRIVFEEVGAYTLVRAHRFNGVELPTICKVLDDGQLEVSKIFSFEDFANFYGVPINENV